MGVGKANMSLGFAQFGIRACMWFACDSQSTYIPRVQQCLSPLPNWDPPPPLPQASVSPPNPKGEVTHSPGGEEGVGGGPNSDDWRKSLALYQLCDVILCVLLLEMLTWALSLILLIICLDYGICDPGRGVCSAGAGPDWGEALPHPWQQWRDQTEADEGDSGTKNPLLKYFLNKILHYITKIYSRKNISIANIYNNTFKLMHSIFRSHNIYFTVNYDGRITTTYQKQITKIKIGTVRRRWISMNFSISCSCGRQTQQCRFIFSLSSIHETRNTV